MYKTMELKEVLTSLKTNKINNDLPVLKSINNFWIKNDKYKIIFIILLKKKKYIKKSKEHIKST